jgi:hypothetical protein
MSQSTLFPPYTALSSDRHRNNDNEGLFIVIQEIKVAL